MTTYNLSMSVFNTTRDRAKSLLAAISVRTWIKSLVTVKACSLNKKTCSTLVGASNTTKFGRLTIKDRFKSLLTVRTLAFPNWCSSYAGSSNVCTFLATIFRITKPCFSTIIDAATIHACNPPFREFLSLFVMDNSVLCGCKNLKILNSIVCFNPINMVNAFARTKSSSEMLCHNISVFEHLIFPLSKRIARYINQNMTRWVNGFAALPVPMIFANFPFLLHREEHTPLIRRVSIV